MNKEMRTELANKVAYRINQNDEFDCAVTDVVKTNGIVLTGISVKKRDDRIAPTIYVDDFLYNNDINDIEDDAEEENIIKALVKRCMEVYDKTIDDDARKIEDILDFSKIKFKILPRLTNSQMDAPRIAKGVHRLIAGDLMCSYVIDLGHMHGPDGDTQFATTQVTNEMLQTWQKSSQEKIDANTIHRLSIENAMKLRPMKIQSLFDFAAARFAGNAKMMEEMEENRPMPEDDQYILNNEQGMFGATSILYDSVLQNFADDINCDLYIIPSSVHEVLLIPATMDKKDSENEMKEMIHCVNKEVVEDSEILSDNLYYFERDNGRLSMLP